EKSGCGGCDSVEEGGPGEAGLNREVILSGGAIISPKTLMLSGVGPADHLRAMDIPVVIDLPGVGQNLMDHLLIGVEYGCREPIGLHKADNVRNILNYLLFKKGPLTSSVAEAAAFLKTSSRGGAPNIELVFAPVFYMDNGFKNPDLHGFSIGVALQKSESRGHIKLKSKDPFVAPAIQPNYLASEIDLVACVEGVKLAREIFGSKHFDRFRGKEWWPGEAAKTDDDF